MNIRYISNIFRGENLWNFWCVCPVAINNMSCLRADKPSSPRRKELVFA